MQDVRRTVISQYANSPSILGIIDTENAAVDPSTDFEAFYNLIWNLDTAEDYGLDVWGRIVGVGRTLSIPSGVTYFGFQDGLADYAPFNQAPFYAGTADTQNYALSDTAYRTLILLKAAANIAATDAPSLNALLRKLFAGRGRAYVNDLGSMQMRFTFEFYLEPYELAILTQSGVLPRPAAVDVYLLQAPTGSTFGFAEAGASAQPFNQGAFLAQESMPHVG